MIKVTSVRLLLGLCMLLRVKILILLLCLLLCIMLCIMLCILLQILLLMLLVLLIHRLRNSVPFQVMLVVTVLRGGVWLRLRLVVRLLMVLFNIAVKSS